MDPIITKAFWYCRWGWGGTTSTAWWDWSLNSAQPQTCTCKQMRWQLHVTVCGSGFWVLLQAITKNTNNTLKMFNHSKLPHTLDTTLTQRANSCLSLIQNPFSPFFIHYATWPRGMGMCPEMSENINVFGQSLQTLFFKLLFCGWGVRGVVLVVRLHTLNIIQNRTILMYIKFW